MAGEQLGGLRRDAGARQVGDERLAEGVEVGVFQQWLEAWTRDLMKTDDTNGRILMAIDGKCCRGLHDRSKDLGPMHIVSAWASECGIALGQVATDDKSNEITASPRLLEQIDLKTAIVTIDAVGCQKAIGEQIRQGKGTYVNAVKGNQPTLYEDVQALISKQLEAEYVDLRYLV